MVVVKCCSGCGVVKSLDDFNRDRRNTDGRRSDCKECVNTRMRRYWEENRDKIAERKRRHYAENRDKVLERTRRYREENLEYDNRRASRYWNRRQSLTESVSTKSGTWSEAEVAILMADDGRTIVAKALELGRTYSSCIGKRHHLLRAGATN